VSTPLNSRLLTSSPIVNRISYLITTFLYWAYWIEDKTLSKIVRAVEAGRLTIGSRTAEGESMVEGESMAEEALIMLD
jgi:hypothetical protein